MTKDQSLARQSVLFTETRTKLHEIEDASDAKIPAEVWLHLGELHGSITNLIIQIHHEHDTHTGLR